VTISSPSPQGDVGSNLIVAKMVTSNGGKGGARARSSKGYGL